MAVSTKELKDWGSARWQTQMTHATPSKGGAVGVMFVWVTNPLFQGVDTDDPTTADFVIKPSAGSAATTKVAEDLMARTMGAISLNTLAIPRTDSRFQPILMALSRYRDRVDLCLRRSQLTGQARQDMQALRDRWTQVWPHYQQAKALMVQELARDMKEFADVYRDYSHQGLERALFDDRLMINLGKLFVVDAVLGNGDRLQSINTGNILFEATTARIFSVDSQALLTDYNRCMYMQGPNAKEWVEQIVQRFQGQSIPERPDIKVTPPPFSLADLYDVDRWWRLEFRRHLEDTLHKDGVRPPREELWQLAYRNFCIGVDQGLVAVDQQLSGLNWLGVKTMFKNHEKKLGSSPNLDWTNFKIRRMYVRMALAERHKPGTVEEKQERAMRKVLAYAERKVGGRHV